MRYIPRAEQILSAQALLRMFGYIIYQHGSCWARSSRLKNKGYSIVNFTCPAQLAVISSPARILVQGLVEGRRVTVFKPILVIIHHFYPHAAFLVAVIFVIVMVSHAVAVR